MIQRQKIFLCIKLFLIFVLIAGVIPLSYSLRNQSCDRDNVIGLYAEKDNSLDVIYIGGSACFIFWEPLRAFEKYHFKSYNFATNTLSPIAIKYYMEEVRKTQSPRLWIIDLRPFQYGDGPGEDRSKWDMYKEMSIRNSVDSFSYSSNRNNMIDAAVINKDEKKYYYFDIMKYHTQWPMLLKSIYRDIKNGTHNNIYYSMNNKEDIFKGFYFISKVKTIKFYDWSNVSDEIKLKPEMEFIFNDLISYCELNGDKVLFIVHSYSQQKEDKQKYNYMQRIIKEHGFDYINMNDYWKEIGFDYTKDFYHESHVNVFGAEKYTDFLAKYIKANYELPDRSKDGDFVRWHELYLNFEKKSQLVKEEIMRKM